MANRIWGGLFGATPLPRLKPMSPQGVSGTSVFSGVPRNIERHQNWVGQSKYRTSADIATNVSIVAAGVHYFLNLIAHPQWTVHPANDSDEAQKSAEFVEEVIHDMITPWNRVVRRAGMYRFHGFGIQEWVAKKREDGLIGLSDVESRPQHTIERWEVDERGVVKGAWQRSPHTGELLGLPRSKVVYIVEDTLTDSPEGLGIFRHLAEPYERLKLYLAIEARAYERDLRGVPIGRAPLSAIDAAIESGSLTRADGDALIQGMKDFLQTEVKQPDTAILLDSAMYESQAADGLKAGTTPQYSLDLLSGPALGLSEIAAAIDRLQREMGRIIGVEHLMMGDQGGSRALAVDKSRNLYLIANSVVSAIADAFDHDLIDQLWALNGFDEDLKPYFSVEDVAFKDVVEITAALRDMATAGATLAPDDPAIKDVRELLGISVPLERELEEMQELGLAPPAPPDPEQELEMERARAEIATASKQPAVVTGPNSGGTGGDGTAKPVKKIEDDQTETIHKLIEIINKAFNPDQPRDAYGRFASSGGGGIPSPAELHQMGRFGLDTNMSGRDEPKPKPLRQLTAEQVHSELADHARTTRSNLLSAVIDVIIPDQLSGDMAENAIENILHLGIRNTAVLAREAAINAVFNLITVRRSENASKAVGDDPILDLLEGLLAALKLFDAEAYDESHSGEILKFVERPRYLRMVRA